MAERSPIICLNDISYRYPSSDFAIHLKEFAALRGERIAITGPSGCGKTTLLRLITGLLDPDEGSIRVEECDLTKLTDTEKRALRVTTIGTIPQELDLLEYLCVEENMLLPFSINRKLTLTEEARQERKRLAEALGIADKSKRFPQQLSQGERQRVAIGRALITRPKILLADEPTGNLDGDTARQVLQLIGELIEKQNTTFLMVTHDLSLLDLFDRRLELGKATA